MLLYTLEVIPVILTGGQGKPLLNPQLTSNHRQVITFYTCTYKLTLRDGKMDLKTVHEEDEMCEMKGWRTHYLILQVLGDLMHFFGSQ